MREVFYFQSPIPSAQSCYDATSFPELLFCFCCMLGEVELRIPRDRQDHRVFVIADLSLPWREAAELCLLSLLDPQRPLLLLTCQDPNLSPSVGTSPTSEICWHSCFMLRLWLIWSVPKLYRPMLNGSISKLHKS